MRAVGLSCIRLRLRLRLCSAALLALRARPGSGSSAAARRQWLRLWACASARSSALCFGSSPAVIMHAPAAATRAASTASRAMPTIDTRSSTSTCGSYGHDARAAQNPTVELRRDAGHKVRAWTLGRAACALCDRDAGGTRSTRQCGAIEQTAVRAYLMRSSLPCDLRNSWPPLVSEAMSDCARGALCVRPTVVSGERRGRPSWQGSEWLEARHAPVRSEESAHPGGPRADTSSMVDMPPTKCRGENAFKREWASRLA